MNKSKTSSLKKIYAFWRGSFVHFFEVNGTVKAAALAYATLISLVPLMLLSFSFMLAFPSLTKYFEELHQFLFRHFIPTSANVIQKYVTEFANNAANLSITGLIFFLIMAVLLLFTIENVFNDIWEVKTNRKGLNAFLLYWAVLTLITPLGCLVAAATIFLKSLPYISLLIQIISYIVPFVLTYFGYVFLYMTMPNCKVLFRDAAIGASFAALAIEITKVGFRIYVNNFSSDVIVYGVLSIIPVFLFWLYLAWIITIAGAVIAHRAGLKRNTKI